MSEDSLLPFDLPAIQRKKVPADFAGASISSAGGLVLLRMAWDRVGLAWAIGEGTRELCDPARLVHMLPASRGISKVAIIGR